MKPWLLRRRRSGGTLTVEITSLSVLSFTDTTAQLQIDATPVGATVYWYVKTGATEPSIADLKAGTGAVDFGSYTVTATPSGTPGPTGLTASTGYNVFALVSFGGTDSDISTTSFTTAAPDTTAPVLSAQGATVVDTTSADLVVTTDEGNGTLYVISTLTQGTPSAAQMRLGQDSTGAVAAYDNGGQAVSDTGVQNISATGLTAAAHYAYFMQDDAAGNTSTILETGPFTPADVTAPVVSSVEITSTGTTTVDVTFNTDTAEGTAYALVQTAAAADPDLATVKASTDTLTVTATGPQTIAVTGLTADTEYTVFVVHTDVAGNDSTIEEAPATATTDSATLVAEFYHDGSSTPGILTNSTLTDNEADNDAGTDAVLWENDGLGAGAQQMLVRMNMTFNNGNNVVRARFKTVANNGGKVWLRIQPLSVDSADAIEIDVTNDATPAGSRINPGHSWSSTSMTSEGSDWYTFEGTIDMTGDADLDGSLQLRLGTTSGIANPNNTVAGAYGVAVHDVTVSVS